MGELTRRHSAFSIIIASAVSLHRRAAERRRRHFQRRAASAFPVTVGFVLLSLIL